MHPRAEEILRAQQAAFRKKFGRDPGPGDPVFFDPDADEPAPFSQVRMEAETLDAMRRAGAPPQILYAYRKTGLIVTESSKDHIPADRRAEWDAANKRAINRLQDGLNRIQAEMDAWVAEAVEA